MARNPDRLGGGARCLAALTWLGGFWTGCHQVAVVPSPAGQGSFSFIEPPPPTGQKAVSLAVSEEMAHYRPPVILNDLAAPAYPVAALAAHFGRATIDAEITIGTDGRVSEVSPSQLGLALTGRFAQDFSDAIDRAVAQWRFQAAELMHQERSGASLRVTSAEAVPSRLEVRFQFTAEGIVSIEHSGR